MTKNEALASAILARLDELGWQQKTLAFEWQKRTGKGSVTTYESQLSRLLNDDDEGFAFLLEGKESRDRLRALASALQWEAEELRVRCTAARDCPALIFSSDIPKAQIEFFTTRAARFPDRVRCAVLDGSDELPERERLRDLARKKRNAVVIVKNGRDHDFFAGAGIKTAHVERAQPGFRIEGMPDLFPALPARSQDVDGMQMLPDAEVEKRYREPHAQWDRSEKGQRWIRRIQEADDEGTPVTFRLDWLVDEWGGQEPDAEKIHDAIIQRATVSNDAAERGSHDVVRLDYVWLREGRVVALCDRNAGYARDRIANRIAVHDVTTFDPIVEALQQIVAGLNPRGKGGALDLAEPLGAFAAETGIALTFTMEEVRSALSDPYARFDKALEGTQIRQGAELDDSVHALLDDVLAREWILPATRAPILWTLRAVREARLLHIASAESSLDVLADLGTGNILRLFVTSYKGEDPAPMRAWSNQLDRVDAIDGGNVHIRWEHLFERSLEGVGCNVVRRRRAEAEAARQAEDDYDD